MTAESPLPLREIVKQLGRIRGVANGKTAAPELLALLKAGELKAGFEFPGAAVAWISIPINYWTGISSYKFSSLRYKKGDKHRRGIYEICIDEFIDEYLLVVSNQIRSRPDSTGAALDELKRAVPAARQAYEVAVAADEWANFLQRNQLSMPVARSSRGNREKTSWGHLAPIIAAYMMTLDQRPAESRDHLYIATQILEIAGELTIANLPKTHTLRDVISRAFVKADEFSQRELPRKPDPNVV